MTPDPSEIGQLAGVAVMATLFGWMFWTSIRRRSRRVDDGCVPNLPPGAPYKVYTRAHDLILRARDVPRVLAADAYLRAKSWLTLDPRSWHAKVATAQGIAAAMPDVDAEITAAFEGRQATDWAIGLLIDQSGSMRDDPILHTAATVRRVSDALVAAGVKVAVQGFSTVGWHGGKARQDWLWNGQPCYPGRLCALLHAEYQAYGERLTDDDWGVMLHPDILRENVDGEALEWASERLEERPEPNCLLIVLSDGAPVDDATLLHNGTDYLERHLLSVIDRIGGEGRVMLGAVGIGFAVERYYLRSRSAKDLRELPGALVGLIAEIVTATSQERSN